MLVDGTPTRAGKQIRKSIAEGFLKSMTSDLPLEHKHHLGKDQNQ